MGLFNDEKTLIGKKIGLLFQEEEYYGNDGNLRTRLSIKSEFPIDKVGEQKIPNVKKLKEETTGAAKGSDDFMDIPDDTSDNIPFGE